MSYLIKTKAPVTREKNRVGKALSLNSGIPYDSHRLLAASSNKPIIRIKLKRCMSLRPQEGQTHYLICSLLWRLYHLFQYNTDSEDNLKHFVFPRPLATNGTIGEVTEEEGG
jgi:hypothetical protein